MSTGYWTWEKEEAPAKAAFEEGYHEIMERAKKGEVSIREAYAFHETQRRFSCKYPSVIQAVITTVKWEEIESDIVYIIKERAVTKSELSILRVIFGMKYYEKFVALLHYWMMVEYPETWEAEETAEKARVKKAVEIGKRRLAL